MKTGNYFGVMYVLKMVNLEMELIVAQNVHMISIKNVLKNCLYAINVMNKDNLKKMLMPVHNVNMCSMKNIMSVHNVNMLDKCTKETQK